MLLASLLREVADVESCARLPGLEMEVMLPFDHAAKVRGVVANGDFLLKF
jgi:hypothetical protein